MTRRAPRLDANQPAIVEVLRRFGFSVTSTAGLADGFPDLVVGYRGITDLIEIKDGDKPPSARKLTDDEAEFHASWQGRPVVILESVEDALAFALHTRDRSE